MADVYNLPQTNYSWNNLPGVPSGGSSSNPWQGILSSLFGGITGAFPATGSQSGSGSSSAQGTSNSSTSTDMNTNTNNWLQNLTNFINSSNGSQQQTTSGTSEGLSTPTLLPAAQQLMDTLSKSYANLAKPVDLSGYASQQRANINNTSDLSSQAVNNIMAARGLSTSPVSATAQTGVENQRIGAINNLNASLPLVANQLNTQNLGAATNFFSAIPHGNYTSGVTSGLTAGTNQQVSSGQQTNNQTGGGTTTQIGNTNTMGSTSQQQQQNQNVANKSGGGVGGAIGGAISGILPFLPLLFSDKRLKKEIKPVDKAVDKIMALRPSTWKWRGGEVQDAGFVAQDVMKVLPELVHEDEPTKLLKVNYAGLIPFLVSAVQDLNSRVGE